MIISIFMSFQPAGAVRAAAFRLFGSLSRFGKGHSKGPFLEQIQTNFVSVLLHLNEDEEEVKSVGCFPKYVMF